MKVNTTFDEQKISIKNKVMQKKNSPKFSDVEDRSDQGSLDSSQDSLRDECIFPSPIPISKEEAMRETQCHFARQNFRDLANFSASPDDGSEDFRHAVFFNARPTVRREVEKPPRLQKQMSRDRLPPFNKQGFSTESPLNGVDAQSQGSCTECLDSTGVDVHEFLVRALQSNPRDRNILLKLERDMIKFCKNNENAFMRFPEMTSYHRMLIHRVAAYFGMDHNIDAKGKSVIINKTEFTRVPEKSFRHYIIIADENAKEEDGRRSILKRMKNCKSFDHTEPQMNRSTDWREARQRSFEEREDHYERTRARIFQENHSRSDQFRLKDKVTSQRKNRQRNNGTDADYSADNNHSSSRSSNHPGKSGMTILSRRNNMKGSTSSSSSTSSLFQQHHNDFSLDHALCPDNDHLANHQPIQYPHLGAPHVGFEGQQPPVILPSYVPPPYYSNPYPQDSTRMPSSHEVNGVTQNDLAPPDVMNPSSLNIFPPPSPFICPYQPVPMPFYTYPLAPIQHGPAGMCPSHTNGFEAVDNLTNGVVDMKLDDASQLKGDQSEVVDTNTANSDLTSDLSNSDDARSHDHDIVSTPANISSQSADKSSDVDSADAVPSSASSQHGFEGVAKVNDVTQNAETEPAPIKQQYFDKPCVSTTVSTGLGSITYYTADPSRPPLQTGNSGQPVFVPPPAPLYPVGMVPYGLNGKFSPHPNLPESFSEYIPPGGGPPMHPGFPQPIPGIAPAPFYYMVNNQRMDPYQPVPLQSVPFFFTPASNAYPPPAVSPPQPPATVGVVTQPPVNVGVVTQPPATVGVVTQPPVNVGVVTQPPVNVGVVTQPPVNVGVVTPNGRTESEEVESKPVRNGDVDPGPNSAPPSLHVMSLRDSTHGIDDPKVNSLASCFEAKIVQLSNEDDKENLTKDIFPFFASSNNESKAREETKKLNGLHLVDMEDTEKAKPLRDPTVANWS